MFQLDAKNSYEKRKQKMLMKSTPEIIGVCTQAFHGFGQAKFDDGVSILGTQLPQLPLKMMHN